MKNYLKYLKSKPLKIIWLIFVLTIVTAITVSIFMDWQQMIAENSQLLCIGILFFLFVVLLLSFYQPYKEYKDGLDR